MQSHADHRIRSGWPHEINCAHPVPPVRCVPPPRPDLAMIVALPLFSLAATSGPGTLPAPAYDASANGECDRLLPVL